jgi:hypothetical protein
VVEDWVAEAVKDWVEVDLVEVKVVEDWVAEAAKDWVEVDLVAVDLVAVAEDSAAEDSVTTLDADNTRDNSLEVETVETAAATAATAGGGIHRGK